MSKVEAAVPGGGAAALPFWRRAERHRGLLRGLGGRRARWMMSDRPADRAMKRPRGGALRRRLLDVISQSLLVLESSVSKITYGTRGIRAHRQHGPHITRS